MPRAEQNLKGFPRLHPYSYTFESKTDRNRYRRELKRRPLNQPTKKENLHLGMVITVVRYNQDRQHNCNRYDAEIFQREIPQRAQNSGIRVRWFPDPTMPGYYLPQRSEPDTWIAVHLHGKYPLYLSDTSENRVESQEAGFWVYACQKALDLDSLRSSHCYLLEKMHQKMEQAIVGTSHPKENGESTWYLPHGDEEKYNYSVYMRAGRPTDRSQEDMLCIWTAQGALHFDETQLYQSSLLDWKPLDLDIYEVENFGTLVYAPEIKMLRISRAIPIPYMKGAKISKQVQAIYLPERIAAELDPPKNILGRTRNRYIEIDTPARTTGT